MKKLVAVIGYRNEKTDESGEDTLIIDRRNRKSIRIVSGKELDT